PSCMPSRWHRAAHEYVRRLTGARLAVAPRAARLAARDALAQRLVAVENEYRARRGIVSRRSPCAQSRGSSDCVAPRTSHEAIHNTFIMKRRQFLGRTAGLTAAITVGR